jgi:hypothetical protein
MTRQTLLIIFLPALYAWACLSGSEAAAALAHAQPNSAAVQAQSPAGIAAIEAYVRQMDAYVKRNSRRGRLFADTSDYTAANVPPRWQEFRNKRELERAEVYSAATVWSNTAGDIVVAEFSLSSPSGDWAQYNTYYYRNDGTLAKRHSELRTFMGDLIVIRDRLYDPTGKMLQTRTRYLDLTTRKPKKAAEGSFQDMPIELYAKTSSLPFYALLKKQR